MLKNYQVTWKPNEAGFLFVTRMGAPLFNKGRGISPVDDPRRAGDLAVRSFTHFRHAHTSLLLDSGATPKVVSVNCDTPMLGLR